MKIIKFHRLNSTLTKQYQDKSGLTVTSFQYDFYCFLASISQISRKKL